MKRIICIFLTLILSVSVIACGQKAPETPQKVVEAYYERFYDCWLDLEYRDMSDILDMDSVQMYNKNTRLREVILVRTLTKAEGEAIGETKTKCIYTFSETEYTGEDEAVLTVNIEHNDEPTAAHPFFIYLGENVFKLKKIDGSWKIVSTEINGIDWLGYGDRKEKVEFDPKAIEESWRKNRE